MTSAPHLGTEKYFFYKIEQWLALDYSTSSKADAKS